MLRVLEDLGWEAIDNFPIRLLERLIDTASVNGAAAETAGDLRGPLAIGFDARTRGFNPHEIIQRVKTLSRRPDLELTTLFLDCAGRELERRYNETRRRHPLAADMPVPSGIAAERELLEPLRRWADSVIDTTPFAVNELQQVIRERFTPGCGPYHDGHCLQLRLLARNAAGRGPRLRHAVPRQSALGRRLAAAYRQGRSGR